MRIFQNIQKMQIDSLNVVDLDFTNGILVNDLSDMSVEILRNSSIVLSRVASSPVTW